MSKEIVCASREEWLAERKNGIGASEVATALGVNPFKSAFELWAEITGLAEAENLDDRETIIWGKLLEGPIIGEFGRRTGRVVDPHNQNVMLVHPTHGFLRGTPDALQRRNERADPGDLQIKTTSL
jgi:putative phage-type endonuclease